MSRLPRSLRWVVLCSVVVGLGWAAIRNQDRLKSMFRASAPVASNEKTSPAPIQEPKVLKMSQQARRNLKLVSKPVKPQSFWRKILVPGEVVDRPGLSDRGVTSPAVGVVTQVHAFPGDTVRPGDRLFTLRLISEYLQNTQSELFRAVRETELINEQLERLRPLAANGGLSQAKLIEHEQQLKRQQAAIEGYRQDLLTRGLNPEQIGEIQEGRFIASIDVVAPPARSVQLLTQAQSTPPINSDETASLKEDAPDSIAYEVQDLQVDLGTQVQAGQLLSVLADHSSLYIEGHAFKREATYLEQAAQQGWPIEMEFAEDDSSHWPTLDQTFQIRHLSNSIDSSSRTFDFFTPLKNQSRSYVQDDKTFVVWRFRPGQRVRLHVPVEELRDVIVVPAAALVREGPEAYVFQQNGDLFNRLPVHVLHEERLQIVLANDGSVKPGLYLAQSAAASLNRVMKAQAASGIRVDVHVHADGTVHAAH